MRHQLIVEKNYRIYAYTSSDMHLALLSLFVIFLPSLEPFAP
jgi:hypothetical protein